MTKHGLNLKCEAPDGCDRKRHAKQLCSKHYARLLARGSAELPVLTWRPAERFWPQVQMGEGCWEWTGYKYPNGYGTVRVCGKSRRAHTISYEMVNGPVPEGLILDHICRNRACVRPDHLRPVTSKQNAENRTGSNLNKLPRGVSQHKKTGKYRARVIHNWECHYVGQFDTAEEAAAAAVAKRNELYTHNESDRMAS